MEPIEIDRVGFPVGKRVKAVTLWPFIFYHPEKRSKGVRAHEYYHWYQATHWFVLPWYIAYIALLLVYRASDRRHPMERRAYEIEYEIDRRE